MNIRTKVIALFMLASYSVLSTAGEVTLTITEINKQQGHIMVALYDSQAAYDGDAAPAATARIAVTGQSVQTRFGDLADGEYAIKLYHDENNNGELDTNFMGIPAEGYGFSNNAIGSFGPASYTDARFTVEGNKSLSIQIR